MTWIAPPVLGFSAMIIISACGKTSSDREASPRNTKIESFNKAKRLAADIYRDQRRDFYCDCPFGANLEPKLEECGYSSPTGSKRARRIEWEHVVPAAAFGRSFPAWRDGTPSCVNRKGKGFRGRNCARKVSRDFRRMEADLYNLVPAVGEINARRQNFAMAMIAGEERVFGQCDVEISERKIEPRPEIRGDIARIYLYMDGAYPDHGIIAEKNRKLFTAWSHEDPVSPWECERARRIAKIQGNRNPFVEGDCRDLR